MIRKVFSLLFVGMMASGVAMAQSKVQLPCTTTEMNDSYKQTFPEIQKYEDELRTYIQEEMKSLKLGNRASAKGTFGPNDVLHVPVVVHVIHDYTTADYVSDNDVFQLIDQINEVYMKRNADTSDVIAPWKPYIGNPNITFHLATKDPYGNPTTGITRRRSYLSNGGDDQAKFDQWDPTSYLNIWIIRRIGRGIDVGVVAAYAVFPASAAAFPYTDGIISSASSLLSNKTIPHEIGHILNLIHTWGNVAVAASCTGDDEVDDTTPTTGHYGSNPSYGQTANGRCDALSLYDTSCTNVIATLSKILLDTSLAPKVNTTNGIGFDYEPLTRLKVEGVKIYPTSIGSEFEIANYNGNTKIGEYVTQRKNIGKVSLGSDVVVSTSDTLPIEKSAIVFDAQKYMWIDSFDIYPNTIGDTFTIQLFRANNTVVKSYTGVTTTNTGKQVVPFAAFFPDATGYRLRITRNPGLKCDSIKSTPTFPRQLTGAMSFVQDLDTANVTSGYLGRYNFFYNWSVRYDALTTTDSSEQLVPLAFDVLPGTTYSLKLDKNPGVWGDSIGVAPYIKSKKCIINISNETTNNRYNLLYELKIRHGYVKNCIDYPDTANTQNIMDYADCPKMFTKLQVERMRATLASDIAGRNNWVNDTTHVRTGILTSLGGSYGVRNDMKPVPDFSVEAQAGPNRSRTYFQCGTETFRFKNRSWRDTIESSTWTFSNGAANATVNETALQVITPSSIVNNTFSEYGWVDVTISARGNNTGDTSVVMEDVVYAADPNFTINPQNGYMMDFNAADTDPKNDLSKYPMFNYYKNDFKWEVVNNVGHYDNSCIRFTGYDSRVAPAAYNGTPKGDFDDFFTPAFDLSGMKNTDCRLNFMSAGAFRVTNPNLMRDTLEIAYSTDCGGTWTTFAWLDKSNLGNKGTVVVPFSPLWLGDWKLNSFDVPAVARDSRVFFRFRYRPSADDINFSASRTEPGTGNHFYLDRLNISSDPLGTNTLLSEGKDISLAPNPTNGTTQLIIRTDARDVANIQVTDVTGKVVYTIQHELNGGINNIEIPASVIKVKGVYMVHVLAGEQKFTEKLVSY